MKKLILSLVAIATLSISSFGQAPEGFKYQAVVRDAGNLILNNQAVGMQLTIQQGSIGGTAVYTETFSPTSNAYGLVNIEIGSGSTTDDFSTIDWSAGPYFIETAMDVTGGTTYVVMGTSQFMSVPYALYAKTSGNGVGPQGPAGNDGIDGVDGAIGATGPQGPAGADGQGGVITAGSGINVTGAGTIASPYVVSTTSACGLAIGDTYAGGIIFFLDGSGCHGLVAKATNEPVTYQWSSTNFNTYAIASGIYGGAQNTKKSIAKAGAAASTCPAASVCDNLTSGGYTDWYLPSKDELDMMYVNLHMQGLGGFALNFYWSSTEYDSASAWDQNFLNGYQTFNYKFYDGYVRAVRAF